MEGFSIELFLKITVKIWIFQIYLKIKYFFKISVKFKRPSYDLRAKSVQENNKTLLKTAQKRTSPPTYDRSEFHWWAKNHPSYEQIDS